MSVDALPHDSFPALEELTLELYARTMEFSTQAFSGSRMLRRLSFITHSEALSDIGRVLVDFPFAQITDAFICSSSCMIFDFVKKLESLRTATFIAQEFRGGTLAFAEPVDLPIETLELQGRHDEFEPFLRSFSLPRLREFRCNLTHPSFDDGFFDADDAHAPTLQHFIARSTSIARLIMENMDEWLLYIFEDSHTFESIEEFKICVDGEGLSLWPHFMKMLTYHPTSSVLPLFPRLRGVEFDIRSSRQQDTEVERIDDSLAVMILSRYNAVQHEEMWLLERCHYCWKEYAGTSTAREHFSVQLQSCFDDGLVMEGFA
ncbi:hypothetical protein FISHEDRAFT_75006 [Fistulina hepatica ATCC 64428]|uniref:Uncharacterized protein n=1 Tax=Fistulina hepatica ATCC 64428 TaxID=1128425 RepID=A0A0D7A8N6_9AGAR|nr:hypothetical protein FISHEDRAFT_75006 [Fistulina hepatica ATCC 64428]